MRARTDSYAYMETENILVRIAGISERIGTILPQLEWSKEAECRGEDADLFFPSQGDSVREAKEICGRCIVQMDCLQYAIDAREPGGIWGGFALKNRNSISRAMDRNGGGAEAALVALGYRFQTQVEKLERRRLREESNDLVEAV
jgi:WhiB family redox-sensing transcriptional regulator